MDYLSVRFARINFTRTERDPPVGWDGNEKRRIERGERNSRNASARFHRIILLDAPSFFPSSFFFSLLLFESRFYLSRHLAALSIGRIQINKLVRSEV